MDEPEEARIQALRDEHAAELAKVREERASLRRMNDLLADAVEMLKKSKKSPKPPEPQPDDPA